MIWNEVVRICSLLSLNREMRQRNRSQCVRVLLDETNNQVHRSSSMSDLIKKEHGVRSITQSPLPVAQISGYTCVIHSFMRRNASRVLRSRNVFIFDLSSSSSLPLSLLFFVIFVLVVNFHVCFQCFVFYRRDTKKIKKALALQRTRQFQFYRTSTYT